MDINCLAFDDFETLDFFGPIEVFGMIEDCTINCFSMDGGKITSRQGVQIITKNSGEINQEGILIIPGGKGTRTLVDDNDFIGKLKTIAGKSSWCLTICTGSALLAKTGLLDNCEATSNKISFGWVKTSGKNVKWNYNARWTVDKKYYTSSGISAGIDMSIGFVFDNFGMEKAKEITRRMEYNWNNNKNDDTSCGGYWTAR